MKLPFGFKDIKKEKNTSKNPDCYYCKKPILEKFYSDRGIPCCRECFYLLINGW